MKMSRVHALAITGLVRYVAETLLEPGDHKPRVHRAVETFIKTFAEPYDPLRHPDVPYPYGSPPPPEPPKGVTENGPLPVDGFNDFGFPVATDLRLGRLYEKYKGRDLNSLLFELEDRTAEVIRLNQGNELVLKLTGLADDAGRYRWILANLHLRQVLNMVSQASCMAICNSAEARRSLTEAIDKYRSQS